MWKTDHRNVSGANSISLSLHLRLNGFVPLSHLLYVNSFASLTPFSQIYSKKNILSFFSPYGGISIFGHFYYVVGYYPPYGFYKIFKIDNKAASTRNNPF